MRIKTLVAVYFWILEFDDVTCIRSIVCTYALLTYFWEQRASWDRNDSGGGGGKHKFA